MLFKSKPSTIFIIPPTYSRSSEQQAVHLAFHFPHTPLTLSLTTFMLYHVQQRMWLCDFDEFGLAEETVSVSPIMSKLVYYHFLSLPLHSFFHISPSLSTLSYPHIRLDAVASGPLSLYPQPVISYPLVSPTVHSTLLPFPLYQYTHHHFMSCSTLSWSV